MRIPVSTLVRTGFGMALIILCVVSGSSYWVINEYIDSAAGLYRNQAIIETLGHVLADVAHVQSAARGYALSGNAAFLETHAASVRKVRTGLAELHHLTAGQPGEQNWLIRLETPVEECLESAAATIRARKEDGLPRAAEFAGSKAVRQATADVRAVLGTIENEQKQQLQRASRDAGSRARMSLGALIAGTLLSFGILLLIYLELVREVERRKRSERVLIHLNRLHAVLSHVSQAVVRSKDRDELLSHVCRIAVEDGQFRMAWVGMVEDDGSVRPVAHSGVDDGYLGAIRVSTLNDDEGRGPTGACLRQGRYYICQDIATDPIMLPWRDAALQRGYRSSAAFPLVVAGRLIGAFCVYGSETGLYGPENVSMLDEIATELSFALQYLDDLEQRRRAELEVLRLNQDLERRVTERTEELNAANQQLAARNQEVEQTNRMKGAFLARMSHELRTPLNAILGFTDLLADGSAGPLAEKQQRFVFHVQTGARHLLEVINDILDLSRIDAGRTDLLHQEFLAAEALGEVLSVIRPLAEIKHIAIEAGVDGALSVYADRTRFKQILYNLLSNAVKFTPEGGSVRVESRWEESAVCFTVTDTGVGIPAEEHYAIFDEFHQVSAISKGKEGTGLGLAITRRLVELHGGAIRVESEPGKGSRFLFTLGPGSTASERRVRGTAQ